LEREFSLKAHFKDPKTIYIERIVNQGEMLQEIRRKAQIEFYATIGLKVEPGEPGSGVLYKLGVEKGCIPKSYHTVIEECVMETLKRGLYGWEITDCVVTLTKAGICPLSTVSEFRKSTPLVLMGAVQKAKTFVCEPISSFELEIPTEAMNHVITKLIDSGAMLEETEVDGDMARLLGSMQAHRLHAFERQLAGLTQGNAVFISRFEGYTPVTGDIPRRKIFDGSLVDRRKLRSE
jgi:ribosomal protection tetracycline resistance protein